MDDKFYHHIEEPEAGILHVARGGYFYETLDVTDIGSCFERMMGYVGSNCFHDPRKGTNSLQ